MKILIVAAVRAEKDAVRCGLNNNTNFDVIVAGVGPVAAAVNTVKALASSEYSLVISAGIGGGFPGKVEVGSLVVANKIVAADLGAETPEGFCSLDKLGYGSTSIRVVAGLVDRVSDGLLAAKLPVKTGPVLTLSTVTGTAETAAEVLTRVPEAVAEAMEGYGVAKAAQSCGIPAMEIRAISNMVGPRDRSAWQIKEALEVLEEASSVLVEVLA